MRRRIVCGWVLLGFPWLLGFLVVVDPGAVIRLHERVSQGVCQPLERGLDEQNANLKALQTATALEAALVERCVRQNETTKTLLCRTNVLVMISVLAILIFGGLTHQGLSLLLSASREGRYLRIIRAFLSSDFR